MTSPTVSITPSATLAPEATSPIKRFIIECIAMTKRNVIHTIRIPDLLVGSTLSPIMFVLLFRYVFGGAIQTDAGSYVNYLMAGIFVQTIVFGSTVTGFGLAEDLQKGVIDRFRSLPISGASVLIGRTIADQLRNVLALVVMFVVGLAVGFRPEWNLINLIAAPLLILLFGFAFSWFSTLFGLYLKSVEAVQQVTFMLIMPLTFASSAFVPINTMPGWLQSFAANQPLTQLTEASRALLLGTPVNNHVVASLGWIAVILAVSMFFATRRFQRINR